MRSPSQTANGGDNIRWAPRCVRLEDRQPKLSNFERGRAGAGEGPAIIIGTLPPKAAGADGSCLRPFRREVPERPLSQGFGGPEEGSSATM